MQTKVFKFLTAGFVPLVILYSLLAAYRYLSQSEFTGGDETLFLADLKLIQEKGWKLAIEKNISIPYMILVYPFSLLFKNYVALRIINVLLLISFFIYLYQRYYEQESLLFPYMFFYVGAVAFLYSGTNDALFSLSLAIFFIECYKCRDHKTKTVSIAFSALVVAIFTRELFIVYLPVIFLGLFTLVRFNKLSYRKLKFPIFLFSILLLLNLPSLLTTGQLSFDKKSPPKNVNATWTQRQYLAQLMVNSGELPFHSHPTWEETEHYLKINGSESLPDSTLKGVTMDLSMTLKEFFKDLFYILVYHSRILGLILVITTPIFLRDIFVNPKFEPDHFPIIAVGIMTLIFSIIIISYIEMRWLAPVFLLSILRYSDLEAVGKVPLPVRNLNIFFLFCLTIYGTYGILGKIL